MPSVLAILLLCILSFDFCMPTVFIKTLESQF